MNQKKILGLSLKLILTIALIVWVLYEVDLGKVLKIILLIDLQYLGFAFLLLLVSQYVGIKRWCVSSGKFNIYLTRTRAIASYFIGMSGAAVTPGRVGEAARMFNLPKASKASVVTSIFIERFSSGGIMLLATVWPFYILEEGPGPLTLMTLIAGILLVIIFHWKIGWLILLIRHFPVKLQEKLNNSHWIETIRSMASKDVFDITRQSLLQWIVLIAIFTLIVLGLADADPLEVIPAVIVIYTTKTFLAFSFGELGVREAASIFYLGTFCDLSSEVALGASLIMWILEIVLPALAGLPFLAGLAVKSCRNR